MPPSPPGGSSADEVAAWVDVVAADHERRREAMAPPTERATALCVTRRPDRLGDIVENVRRQSHRPDLVLVCHGDGFSDELVVDAVGELPGATWLRAPSAWSLGACLNAGLERCATRYVAKFDDDDLYGAHYLDDAVRTAEATGATIVGKQSHFVHLPVRDVTILRFPGREHRPAGHLAGGTLLIDRRRLDRLRFPDATVGEDRGLIGACLRRGRVVWAGDMFGYLQCRGGDNTWQATEEYLGRGSLEVGTGDLRHHVLI